MQCTSAAALSPSQQLAAFLGSFLGLGELIKKTQKITFIVRIFLGDFNPEIAF